MSTTRTGARRAVLAAVTLTVATLIGGCAATSPAPDGPRGADAPAAPSAAPPGDAEDDAAVRPGWELGPGSVGLAPLGLSCAELPRYTGPVRPAAGTTIREVRVESPLDLSAGDIVVERTCVRPLTLGRGLPVLTTTDYTDCDADGCRPAAGPVTVRDCEIDGSALDPAVVAFSTGFMGVGTVQRCDIHGVGSGIAVYNAGTEVDALVEANHVHDLRSWGDPATDGSHSDGITVRDFDTRARPDRTAVVRGNHVDSSATNTTAAMFIQASGALDNVTVEGNLLTGLGYQLVLEAGQVGYGAGLVARDNRMSGTGFGATYVGGGAGWGEWSGNHLVAGAPVPTP